MQRQLFLWAILSGFLMSAFLSCAKVSDSEPDPDTSPSGLFIEIPKGIAD